MKVSERDIDKILLRNLEQNSSFRNWLIVKHTQLPVFPYEFIEAKRSVRDPQLGETDIFFKIRVLNPHWIETVKFLWEKKFLASYAYDPSYNWSNIIVFLLENKICAGEQPEQPERYEKRGRQGIEQKKWAYFRCGIVAPRSYIDYTTQTLLEHPRPRWGRVSSYSRIILHEKILEELQKSNTSQEDIKMLSAAIIKANRQFSKLSSTSSSLFS